LYYFFLFAILPFDGIVELLTFYLKELEKRNFVSLVSFLLFNCLGIMLYILFGITLEMGLYGVLLGNYDGKFLKEKIFKLNKKLY